MVYYKWTIQLGANGQTYDTHPIYKGDLSLTFEQESGKKFFRRKLSSKITFVSTDADVIINAPFYTEFIIVLKKSTSLSGTYTEYWRGHFYKTDCTISEDDRNVQVQPQVVDQYNDVLNGMDKEFNLIELAPVIQPVEAVKRPMFQIYTAGEDIVTCLSGGNSFEQDVVDGSAEKANDCRFAGFDEAWEFNFDGNPPPAGLVHPFTGAFSGYGYGGGDVFSNSDGVYKLQYFETESIIGYNNFGYRLGRSNGILIKRLSDNVVIWEYKQAWITSSLTDYWKPLPVDLEFSPKVEGGNVVYALRSGIGIFGRMVLDKDSLRVGTVDYNVYEIQGDDMVINNRNYHYCVPFKNLIIQQSARTSVTPTEWGRNDQGQYFLPPNDTDPWYPVGRSQWVNTSVWVKYTTTLDTFENAGRKEFTIKDTFPLWSVISVLLAKIAPSITHQNTAAYSQFFYNNYYPSMMFGSIVCIAPKSNIIVGEYQEPAMKAPVTLGTVLDMLKNVYGCYWYIDSSNRFVIEHIRWFKNGGSYASGQQTIGYDLTTLKNRNGKKWDFGMAKYNFEKQDMPARYEYAWMDDGTKLFNGSPINVLSTFVKEDKVEEITIANFTSDIDYMLMAPEMCSKDGFALLQPYLSSGVYKLPIDGYGIGVYSYYLQNDFVSMYILQNLLLTYDMPSWNIEVDGVAVTANGIQRNKKQEVTFPAGDDDPNMQQLVKTSIGNGEYDKLSVNLSSRMAKVTLKYDTYTNGQ